MTGWSRVSLGDGVMATASCADIAAQFKKLFMAADMPADVAVFKRHDFENNLQCEVTVFFSPAAYKLARHFNATRCAQPSRYDLELLAGDAKCWLILFGSDAPDEGN